MYMYTYTHPRISSLEHVQGISGPTFWIHIWDLSMLNSQAKNTRTFIRRILFGEILDVKGQGLEVISGSSGFAMLVFGVLWPQALWLEVLEFECARWT